MKARELIHNGLYKVGDDIVRFRALNGCLYRPNGCFYGQLYENSEDGSLEVQVSYGTWKKLEPIPLAEEILKANADGGSCSFDEFRSLYHLKNNGYHREISISFDKTWNVPFVAITGMGRTAIKVDMQFFHELQHALRLCGLNELADNFKIE